MRASSGRGYNRRREDLLANVDGVSLRAALREWRKLPDETRAQIVDFLVDDALEQQDELARLVEGKPLRCNQEEIATCNEWIAANMAVLAILRAAVLDWERSR